MSIEELLLSNDVNNVCAALDILEIDYDVENIGGGNLYEIKIIYYNDNINKYRNLKELYPKLNFKKSYFSNEYENYILREKGTIFYY